MSCLRRLAVLAMVATPASRLPGCTDRSPMLVAVVSANGDPHGHRSRARWRSPARPEGIRISGAGLLIGLSAVMGTSRLLGSFLYGVEPGDPLTFVSVAVLLGTVALIACIRPAIQVTAVGPIEVLKAD